MSTRRSALVPAVLALAALSLPGPRPAGAQERIYGTYPDLDWRLHETAHFRIYYYPEAEWTARRVAKYAEAAYPRLAELFDYPLEEKLAVVVRDQEDYSNGLAAYWIDRVTLWSKPLYYILRGRQDWVSEAFTHELSHMFSLKAGDWKAQPSLVIGSALVEDGVRDVDFGAMFRLGFTQPFWWAEGIAEYGDQVAGYNEWTTSRDMHLRLAVHEDTLLTWGEMSNAYFTNRFDGEKGYQQGYSMGLYVMENFGARAYAELAGNNARQGHLLWDRNLLDVLGMDAETLFQGYLAWMRSRYERQLAPILADERAGRGLLVTSREEEIAVVERLPDGRARVELGRRTCEDPVPEDEEEARALAQARKEERVRVEVLDRSQRRALLGAPAGSQRPAYSLWPRASPDGRLTAFASEQGIALLPLPVDEWPALSGRYLSRRRRDALGEDTRLLPGSGPAAQGGFAFSPDGRKVLYPAFCASEYLPCLAPDGYHLRLDLYEYDVEREEVTRLTQRLRAELPAYSPDGTRIAFVHFEDGQAWLGLMPARAREVTPDGRCELDGEPREGCITWLIQRRDGTQLGQPSFSPDGRKIVLDLYREGQQDVWWLDADGGGLEPLTWDRAEDRDAKFAPDGESILFSSDRSGVFDVYRMDLASREVRQLTRVAGGAYHPWLTPAGHLIYAYFTSLRFEIRGLRAEAFWDQASQAGRPLAAAEVARSLGTEEPLPAIREGSEGYNPFLPSNWLPPTGLPLLIYERRGMQVGVAAILEDVLDKHGLYAQVLLGQSSIYMLQYENRMWYPSFRLSYLHADRNYDFAQGFDFSRTEASDRPGGDYPPTPESHFPAPLRYKNRVSYDLARAIVALPLSERVELEAAYDYRFITAQNRTSDKAQAYLTNNAYRLTFEYSSMPPAFLDPINPRGRTLVLDYVFVRSGLPTKDFADVEWLGRTNPPGDHSDDYNFHELQLGYTESIPVTWWNKEAGHTLEIHLRGGWQNRNVARFDEFFAGSMHPMRWVPSEATTHEFAGYEDYTLSGETMLVLSVLYRFPLRKEIGLKLGPFFFTDLYCELFGTAGNLWGYTAEFVTDEFGNIVRDDESYWDPKVRRGTARREIPFVDIASKNGNYLLYDVGLTLKLKGFFTNRNPWNSFLRISYGLNDIAARFDVNDDRAYVDAYPNDKQYAELEPKGLRISIGLGSSF